MSVFLVLFFLTSELVAEASLAREVGVCARVAVSRGLQERAASAEPLFLPAAGGTCTVVFAYGAAAVSRHVTALRTHEYQPKNRVTLRSRMWTRRWHGCSSLV